jgi:hypothetical protein
MVTWLLAWKLAVVAIVTGHDPSDALLFAETCQREATPLVTAHRLCAVAWVESRLRPRAVNGGGHCGAWQQHPRWSQMWGDDCYTAEGVLTCRQPGGDGVTCGELTGDVNTAGRVAARHLHYLTARYGTGALCRYAGATGVRCIRYASRVRKIELMLGGQYGT